jgi:hypothetical protein
VVVDGTSSSCKTQLAGLPQGAVLSPIFFTLYITDIPRLPQVQLALYADDTAVLTQSWRPDTISRRFNQAADRLIKYFTHWRIRVNTAKTEAIIFTKRRPIPPSATLYRRKGDTVVDGSPLPGPPVNHHSHRHSTRQMRCTNSARPTSSTVSPPLQGLHADGGHKTSTVPGIHPVRSHIRSTSLVLYHYL